MEMGLTQKGNGGEYHNCSLLKHDVGAFLSDFLYRR